MSDVFSTNEDDAPLKRLRDLEANVHLLEAALDALPEAVLLIDGRGRLVHANASGHRLLQEQEFFCLDDGVVVSKENEAREKPLVRYEPLTVNRRLLGYPSAEYALFITPGKGRRRAESAAWRQRFHLTEAETRLADALVNGKRLPELATDWRLSLQTLKSQLASIFLKTGTHRQAQLVALLLSGTAWMLGG